ncbi:MAG: DNA topoisomerase-1, partial [Halobacteriales archaeon]
MDTTRVFAGDCTVIHDRDDRSEYRGRVVVVVVKADNTVLVHDAEGYQPVAWITRADVVACEREVGRIVV